MEIKKLFALGIIFLFIGVAVTPSINSTVVKASDDIQANHPSGELS